MKIFCSICDWFVDNKLSNTFVPISNVLWSIYHIKQNGKTELIRFWPNDGVSFLNKKILCCFLLYDMHHKNVWKCSRLTVNFRFYFIFNVHIFNPANFLKIILRTKIISIWEKTMLGTNEFVAVQESLSKTDHKKS